MKRDLKVTHYWSWDENTDTYLSRFREFAGHGAKHLVLTDDLVRLGMTDLPLLEKVVKQLESCGLSLADAHAPFNRYCNLSLPIEKYRPLMILQNTFVLKLCSIFGIQTCTIHLGSSHPGEDDPLETFDEYSRLSLEQLLPVAEKYGVILNIENGMGRAARVSAVLKMLELFKTPYLGCCYDAGHANVYNPAQKDRSDSAVYRAWGTEGKWGPPPWDDAGLEKLLPHVVTVHLHDNSGISDEHKLPFTGTVDWEHITTLLAKAPRLKIIQNEAIPKRWSFSIGEACRVFEKIQQMIGKDMNEDPREIFR